MADLTIADLPQAVLDRLEQLASVHGRSAAAEASVILTRALQSSQSNPWAEVDAIRDRLAATGQTFGDSADLIREDRER